MFTVLGVAAVAAYHIVSALAGLLAPLPVGLGTAAAIVVFTMGMRLLLLPLSYYALRGQASQARLAPQVQALRQRHAGRPERLQRELTALYRREGTGVFAGCLPVLLQLPFLSVMYTLFRSARIGGHPNGLLGHDLLAAPLGSHWLGGPGPVSAAGGVFLGLFALLAVVAWLSARVTARQRAALQSPPPAATRRPRLAGRPGRPPSGRRGERGLPGRPGRREAGQSQPGRGEVGQSGPGRPDGLIGLLARVVPYTTLAVAAVLPLAAGLYLLTTTLWAAAERALLAGRVSRASSRSA
jgi:YidC/Oxa1 family membrane protein insertase